MIVAKTSIDAFVIYIDTNNNRINKYLCTHYAW